MINVAIVEDEADCRANLVKLLGEYSKISGNKLAIKEYDNALKIIKKSEIGFDIIFMDIQLPDMSGMEASKIIRTMDENVIIVFVTNLENYAIEGYAVDAFDYIVKPIELTRLKQVMARIMGKLNRIKQADVVLKSAMGIKRVPVSSIIYVEVVLHNLVYHTAEEGGTFEVWGSLKTVERQLPETTFVRGNSCYLINLQYVKAVEGNSVLLTDGERLQLSRSRRAGFLAALSSYLMG